ncbi:MAG: DUF58 domain-containing protein [Deltaproteobacteria bacterium]|nr:DUF58 domain-containing protein [Deltaproteobacteria bacterium]
MRRLDDYYRGWLTPSGRMLLWALVAAVTLLLGGIFFPLVVIVAFLTALFAAAALLGAPFRPRVTLTRLLPPPLSAGDTLEYRVIVENRGKRAVRQLDVCERELPFELRPLGAPPPIDVLHPGERREVTLRLLCARRGCYDLQALQAASAFPSALVKWGRRSPKVDRVLVYPKIARLEGFEVPHARNYQPGGFSVASQVGDSTEFVGTREYRDGDRVRDIHWPSSARAQRLIVKEYQEEYFVRLALVLDVEVASFKHEAAFERGLGIAAGIADALAKKDYIIDIFAASRTIYRFQAGRAIAHVENILELLAGIEGGDRLDTALLEAELLPEAPRLSAIVLVFMAWEPRRAALVQKLKDQGVAVRVLLLGRSAGGERPAELAPEEAVLA